VCCLYIGDVSLPLSMEALGHAVGKVNLTLDAGRRGCDVRGGSMPRAYLGE